jgi:hypothetical protein
MEENGSESKNDAREELGPRETLAVWVFTAIVIIVAIIFYNLMPSKGACLEDWGQFGDSFGMINWIISLLSMCGVAYTAYVMK